MGYAGRVVVQGGHGGLVVGGHNWARNRLRVWLSNTSGPEQEEN